MMPHLKSGKDSDFLKKAELSFDPLIFKRLNYDYPLFLESFLFNLINLSQPFPLLFNPFITD